MNITYQIEYSLIGAFLKGGLTAKAREVLSWLEPEMFATYSLATMYNHIRQQARRDNLIDIITLNSDFGEDLATLVEISRNAFAVANLEGYASKVRKMWISRTAQKTLIEVSNKLTNAKDDQLEQITNEALMKLQKLLTDRSNTKPVAVSALLENYMSAFHEKTKSDFKERLLYTQIEAVDNILGGINPTDITVIAGRPGMGKTEFALTITRNLCLAGGSVLFFSLEMDNYQLIDRLLSASGGIGVKKLRNPLTMEDDDFAKMGNALLETQKQQLYLVDRGGLTVEEIISIADNHIGTIGQPNAIVIDYLGLIGSSEPQENETLRIERIMHSLKTFAKNARVPIILLSQLNRSVESTLGNRRPQNSHLSKSSSIENDASQIIMLYRERAYNPDSANPYSEAIITKNRFGELGTAYMKFEKGHFVDCDQALAWENSQSKTDKVPTKQYGNRAR